MSPVSASRHPFAKTVCDGTWTGAASLAAGRCRVAPVDCQKPEGFRARCPIRRIAARQLALATATSVHARLPRSPCCHALPSSLRVLESKGSSPERACFSAMVFRPSTGQHTSLGCSRPPGIDRSDLAADFAAAPLSLLPYRAGRCWSLRVSIGRPAMRSETLRNRPLLALRLFSLLSRPPYSSNLAALEHERSWLSGHW
jgi:hypothetical protein